MVTRADAQPAQHLVAVHVGQHQVEQDDVVVVELGDLEGVLAEIGGVHHHVLGLQHQLDTAGDRAVVFNEENSHGLNPRYTLNVLTSNAGVLIVSFGDVGNHKV